MSDSSSDPFGGTHTDFDEDYSPTSTTKQKKNLKFLLKSSSNCAGSSTEASNGLGPSHFTPQSDLKRLQQKASPINRKYCLKLKITN